MAVGNAIPFWRHQAALHLVMQTEAAECALACLAMVANYHGYETDLSGLRRRFTTSPRGVDLSRMIEIGHALGFDTRPLRVEMEYLAEAPMPCILHWDMNHFVVLNSVSRKGLEIYDPARGRYRMPLGEAGKHFTGVLLELSPGIEFSKAETTSRISLRALAGRVTGLKRAFFQVISIALAIEILGLAIPFQIQWVIDDVIVSGDKSLLVAMTAGFLVVMASQTLLSVARAWLLSWFGAVVSAQWVTNLFAHLLRLPLDYFEKRHIGDVVSRFSSVQSIQNTVTGSFVEALLDGLMGLLALSVLLLYSPALTGCVLATLIVYALLRWALYRALWRANEEELVYGARQQTELMESVRGVQAIKLANKESGRKARLANATLEAAKRSMRKQRITLAFGAINQGLFGTQRILLIAIGAYLVMKASFSAGMLVAFVAYADQFGVKIGGLVDKIVEFRMLRLHAIRIADIALTPPEKYNRGVYVGPEPEAKLIVKGLNFRYSDGEPWVLRNVNLTVEAGESLVIVGPSGCGKSTLGKLLLGLLEPTEGHITIGGVDIRKYGLDNYRRMIGTVMQDDALFAGSIADNISFFDPLATMDEVVSSAKVAGIHSEVMAMPMAYESLVGDMGSALSGGQKQRLVLARAIYRRPKILVLDEATSHLDALNENLINEHIKEMALTRVIIAHRAETIATGDRIFDLQEACLR